MAQVQVQCPGFRSDQIRYSDSDGELEETDCESGIYILKGTVELVVSETTISAISVYITLRQTICFPEVLDLGNSTRESNLLTGSI